MLSEFLSFLIDTAKENLYIPILLLIAYFIYWSGYVRSQLSNHLPTQIDGLKESQRELKEDQKEMRKEIREDIRILNQKVDQNYKALDQKIDQTNQKIDHNFRELVSLLSKDRS